MGNNNRTVQANAGSTGLPVCESAPIYIKEIVNVDCHVFLFQSLTESGTAVIFSASCSFNLKIANPSTFAERLNAVAMLAAEYKPMERHES